MPIRILDSRTANQIAAGEVVENPATLVKELLENSLDAGAKQIRIFLQKGGLREITVIDNGMGIPPQEVRRALERHATSKITCPEDLQSIQTLGFRGEALPSIAAVARLSITTRHCDEESGIHAFFEGGREKAFKETGFAVGTKITVQDLFYNTPARSKFLKGTAAETARVTRTVQQLALSRPDVSFTLYREGKLLLETAGDGCLLHVIVKIYGGTLSRELVALNFSAADLTLNGYISNPTYSRRSRNLQAFFVNRRFVQSPLLRKTLERSYTRIVTSRRYPVAFLFLNLPPDKIDVNVHPGKTEIRFQDEAGVQDFLEQSFSKAFSPAYILAKPLAKPAGLKAPRHQTALPAQQEIIKEHNATFRTGQVFQAGPAVRNIPAPVGSSDVLFKNTFLDESAFDGFILGQVFATYLVLVKDNALIFIDQHAAHERIIWEKLQRQAKAKKQHVQKTLPFTLELPPPAAAEFQERIGPLRDLGLEIEHFGHNTFIIRAVPLFIKDIFSAEMFRDIFEDLSLQELAAQEFLKETRLQLACKAAIKANQVLTTAEMRTLLEQLKKCDNPFFCPHGRPVMFKITKIEMEKQFKRRG
ncbi:MAG: DNA mismatch repair endonuclease MutL [Firmicutes bacterium]|nr:DNA mismatch repair endonuclease MutL [Bacillota bacterium]